MIRYLVLLFVVSVVSINHMQAQGAVCSDPVGDNGADPFCSTTGIVFPNCNATNTDCRPGAEAGPNYGCLQTQPFPAWYYMQVEDSGTLSFTIRQSANEDGSGAQLDVDFICYGPFDDPISPCTSELTAANTVACSYLPDAVESMTINNAIAGQYYLVLITNFSQSAGFISFQQTGGDGSTDCSILEAVLGPNQNICGTDPIELDGTAEGAIRYEWSVFNETTMVFDIIVGETNPILTVAASGRYQLLIEDVDGNTETDEVVITFNEPPVVSGEPQDMGLCEIGNNQAEFDFSANTALILGGQNPTEFAISYYLNQNDADNKENPISEVFSTVSGTIYARIESTNLESCFVTTSFDVIVNPAPNLSASAYRYAFCEPLDGTPDQGVLDLSEVIINLTNASGQTIPLLAGDEPLGQADFVITYHTSQADAIAGGNPIADGSLVNDGDVLFIRVENNQSPNPTGCFNIDNIAQLTVTVDQIPGVNPSVPDLIECASNIEDQNTGVFDLTENDIHVMLVNNPPGAQVIYYASEADFNANNPIGSTEANSYQNVSNPQTITAVVMTSGNCESSDTVTFELRVESLPQLSDNTAFNGVRQICVSSDGTVQNTILLGEDIGATDGQSYLYDWTPDNIDGDGDGNEDAVFVVNQLAEEQVFMLTITRLNSSGTGIDCSNSINPVTAEPYQITLRPTGAPSAVEYSVSGASFSEMFTITAEPVFTYGEEEDLQFKLEERMNGVFNDFRPYQDSPVFENVPSGNYRIVVRNRFGCIPEIFSEIISLLGYPSYFTPNGDGFHDTWELVNIENQPTALIYIFDRFGKLIKQLRPGGAGWDGTYNGKKMPSSEYWFKVEFNEPTESDMPRKVFTGSFSLIR